jgi:hypothetical protein
MEFITLMIETQVLCFVNDPFLKKLKFLRALLHFHDTFDLYPLSVKLPTELVTIMAFRMLISDSIFLFPINIPEDYPASALVSQEELLAAESYLYYDQWTLASQWPIPKSFQSVVYSKFLIKK